MNEITLKNVFEFINTDDAARVRIDLIQPIHNSNYKVAKKLNVTILGDVSKETDEFLQLIEKNSWFAMGAFKAANRLKAQNITRLEPLGYNFYVVTNDTNARGVCNQEGRILWCWADKHGEEYEILPLSALKDLTDDIVNQIVTSWFDLYDAGYDAAL